MGTRISLLPATLATLLLLGFGRDAFAFCRTTTCDPSLDECRINQTTGCVRDGVPLKWKAMPIVYRFHSRGSEKLEEAPARAAIRRAFDTWSNVQCSRGRTSLRFEEGADIDEDKPIGAEQAPEKWGIYFRDSTWPHDNADESLALTNQIYGKTSGNIEYADIEINTAKTKFRLTDADQGDADLQAVMTHEVGHYIGLAHSLDENAIMVARYCEGSKRCVAGGSVDESRQLAADDIKAVCTLYEPPGSSETFPEQRAGCAQSPSSIPGAELACGFGLLFLVGSIVRRRRT